MDALKTELDKNHDDMYHHSLSGIVDGKFGTDTTHDHTTTRPRLAGHTITHDYAATHDHAASQPPHQVANTADHYGFIGVVPDGSPGAEDEGDDKLGYGESFYWNVDEPDGIDEVCTRRDLKFYYS